MKNDKNTEKTLKDQELKKIIKKIDKKSMKNKWTLQSHD